MRSAFLSSAVSSTCLHTESGRGREGGEEKKKSEVGESQKERIELASEMIMPCQGKICTSYETGCTARHDMTGQDQHKLVPGEQENLLRCTLLNINIMCVLPLTVFVW